uniref:phosphoglycerate mutase (2,3-diphosphoglycerate-dependent) n=2 Tax=Hemiselmis andersenii TaxID=464988 RepID=A0A7S0THZ5_HEMAN
MTAKEAAEAFGKDTTRAVRKVKSLAPPEGEASEWDARYIGLEPEDMPKCESLEQVSLRTMCVWEELVVPALRANLRILVVAHGDSVRILQSAMDGADLDQ